MILTTMRALGLAMMLAAMAWGQAGGYSGPAILSRTGQSPGRANGDPLNFRVFGSLSGFLAGGLTPVATDGEGRSFNDKQVGATAGFGGYGVHSGRRSTTGASYGGGFQLYNSRSSYNGFNQSLNINHDRQLSAKWTMGAGVGATQMTSVMSGQSRSPIIDSPFVPQFPIYNEFFDARLYNIGGSVGASYQHNARLTFSMSGGSFMTTRQSRSLVSARGISAGGQVTYAMNRRSQVGAVYSYGNFFFPGGFGRSDINNWMGQYGRVLTPRWTASVGAGVYRAESQRLQRVKIDPAVAAIIGLADSVQVAHNLTHGLAVEAGMAGRYGRAGISFGYSRGITPGNGVFLTARQDAVSANVSLIGTRRWNVGFSGGYARLTQVFAGLVGPAGHFESYGASAGFNYRLFSIVHFNSNADIRRVQLDPSLRSSVFKRDRYFVTVGLAFSPGDLPLHIW